MATVTEAPTQASVVLEDVTWEEYEAQLRIIGNRHIRVNYDDGRMEIMSPLRRHGNDATLLGLMVHELVMEFDIQFEGADPVTLKRADQTVEYAGKPGAGILYLRHIPFARPGAPPAARRLRVQQFVDI